MDATTTGAYLAMLRRAKGLTQQEIAEQLGVSNKTISKWESGGGFPDITVLPALAELYGVTADDILAGETLTERRRDTMRETVSARKQRSLGVLLSRFDLFFALSLSLGGLPMALWNGAWGIPQWVSPLLLSLSFLLLWCGYALVGAPLRYALREEGQAIYVDLWRKLTAATLLQWVALLRMVNSVVYFKEEAILLSVWRPVLFLAGGLCICLLFQYWLRRTVDQPVALVPGGLIVWIGWATVLCTLWMVVSHRMDQLGGPLARALATANQYNNKELVELLREKQAALLGPCRWAKRAILLGGGLSALGIVYWQRLQKRQELLAASAEEDAE